MTKRIIIIGDSFTFGHGCSDRMYYYDNNTKSFVGDPTNFIIPKPSEYCWPALLQQRYPDLNVINLAHPGNCNQSMFRNLTTFFETENHNPDDIVMFHGTYSDRLEIALCHSPEVPGPWVIGYDHQSQQDSMDQYNLAKKMYVTHLYNSAIGHNMSITALLASHSFATGFGMKFMWSLPTESTIDTDCTKYKNNVYLSRLKFMWQGTVMKRDIPPLLNQSRVSTIVNYDFSGEENYDFNVSCRSIDYHVNNKGHSIYFEKEILPALEKLL